MKKKKQTLSQSATEGQLGKVIVDEIEKQSDEGIFKEIGNGFQQLKVIDETEILAAEETPQKTEKIPDTCYWDRKWKEGWSQYRIQELEDNIDNTEKDFNENDLSTLSEQLMNSSHESPAKWKKNPGKI